MRKKLTPLLRSLLNDIAIVVKAIVKAAVLVGSGAPLQQLRLKIMMKNNERAKRRACPERDCARARTVHAVVISWLVQMVFERMEKTATTNIILF